MILEIKNQFNVADLLTKYLKREEIDYIIDYLQHEYQVGRSPAAPELNIIENEHEQLFTFQFVDRCFQS